MLEKELEVRFRERVRKAGALPLKFVSPGKAGVPDRIVLAPGGRVFFVELKQKGKKPRSLQQYTIREFCKLGFPVYVVDSLQAIEAFVREVMPNAPYLPSAPLSDVRRTAHP